MTINRLYTYSVALVVLISSCSALGDGVAIRWLGRIPLLSFAAMTVADPSSPLPAARTNTGTVPASSDERVILGSYPVGRNSLSYELSIAPCVSEECQFELRLLEGQTELSKVDLDWAKASRKPSKDTVDESSGFGDPLAVRRTATAWLTGEDQSSVSTIAMNMRLSAQQNGLLVIQRAGFDSYKRSYGLYVAVEKKLIRVWHFEEGSGPTWSTLELTRPGKDGSQRILFFNGFRYPSNDKPDWLYFTVYDWNASKNELESATGKHPANVLLVGTYATVAEARAAQASGSCLAPFWVLVSDAFSELPKGKFALAAISTEKVLAERKLEKVKGCAGKTPISLLQSQYLQPEEH